jgi:two-component system, OmpR family, sensor kinase
VSRLPIRLRLALFLAAVAAVLLSLVGGFGYTRLAAGLSHDLDLELRQRAQDLVGPVSRPGSSLTDLAGTGFIERGESFAEILTPTGRVLDATPTLRGRALLTPSEAGRAARGTVSIDRSSAPGLNEPARLLATPFIRSGRTQVLVVGDTRENGLEILRRVRDQLLVGIPLLVLLTFVGAFVVAGAALGPVEAMRRRAAELSGRDPALRLPVPPGDDEISRLGATLNELLGRVEATLERERSFVAHASHELRTPLALLRTELELAVRRPRRAEELVGAIDSARDELDRLERLAEDLLLLAQAAAEGELSVHREPVEVAGLLADTCARFAGAAAASGRRIEVGPPHPRIGALPADRQQVQRALTNLVANALEHGDGTIRVEAQRDQGQLRLVVSDKGAGFGAEMLAHGDERFARDPRSAGAGLGLSIVAAVAAAHGGSHGRRDLHPGAEAWLTLPAPPDRTHEGSHPGLSQTIPPPTPSRGV